jgi:hypothetical protein
LINPFRIKTVKALERYNGLQESHSSMGLMLSMVNFLQVRWTPFAEPVQSPHFSFGFSLFVFADSL